MKKQDRYVLAYEGNVYIYGKEDINGNVNYIQTFSLREIKKRFKSELASGFTAYKLVPITVG